MYQAADGWAGVCCLGRQLPALLDQLGLEHEPRWLDPAQRMEHRDELMAHVLVFMLERTKDELVALGPPNKLPIGAVRTPAELVDHEPLIERGFFDDGPDGRLPGGRSRASTGSPLPPVDDGDGRRRAGRLGAVAAGVPS